MWLSVPMPDGRRMHIPESSIGYVIEKDGQSTIVFNFADHDMKRQSIHDSKSTEDLLRQIDPTHHRKPSRYETNEVETV